MRRWLLFVFMAVLAVGLAAAASHAPEVLAEMEAFRVTEIRLEGNRFLSRDEVEATLAVRPAASVWDELERWEDRLRKHPLVEDASVTRLLPGTLELLIEERIPVALVPDPTLQPVDASGRILPIDPTQHSLDLPLITVGPGHGSEALSPAERRVVAGEIARMAQGNPEFLTRISEVALEARGDLRAEVWRQDPVGDLWDLQMNLRFRPNLPDRRIQDGLRVLEDALMRFEGTGVIDLDLRYEDQVVVRLSRTEGN